MENKKFIQIAAMLYSLSVEDYNETEEDDLELMEEINFPTRDMSRAKRRKKTIYASRRKKETAELYVPEKFRKDSGYYKKGNPFKDNYNSKKFIKSLNMEKQKEKYNEAINDYKKGGVDMFEQTQGMTKSEKQQFLLYKINELLNKQMELLKEIDSLLTEAEKRIRK